MSAHRIKSYSAETGYVYQYSFQSSRRARRGLLTAGTEYLFEVSRDRKSAFELAVFVQDAALKSWEKKQGRALSSAEQYAAAKMRLFAAFDETEELGASHKVAVDAQNIHTLLEKLNIQ